MEANAMPRNEGPYCDGTGLHWFTWVCCTLGAERTHQNVDLASLRRLMKLNLLHRNQESKTEVKRQIPKLPHE